MPRMIQGIDFEALIIFKFHVDK